MSTIAKNNAKPVPTSYDGLLGEWMPTAIHDQSAYNNALKMVRRLALVPTLNADQARYLDTLCVLVAAHEKQRRAVGNTKLKPLDVLQDLVAEHGLKVRELGAILGVSQSAASMILKGDRALTLDHVRRLAERFKVNAALFLGSKAATENEGAIMNVPEQERDIPIRSTYNRILRVLDGAELCDTDLLTVLDMVDEHIEKTRKFVAESRKRDDCWDGGHEPHSRPST